MKTSTLYAATMILATVAKGLSADTSSTQQPIASRTMTPSSKTPNANKGSASLVIHYTADEPVTLFFQETLKLKKAMQGYDKVVLLKHDKMPSWLDLSKEDEKLADIKDLPTKSNLKRYLKQLTDDGYKIDVWIVGHGKSGKFLLSNGTYGSEAWMSDDEIQNLPSSAGYSTLPIRMVWSTCCYAETLNSAWVAAGAKVVAGSRHVNFYPNDFGEFAEQWASGTSYGDAIEKANKASTRTVVQTYLAMVHAPANNKKWGNCPFGSTILGDKDCAQDYFLAFWLGKSDWQSKYSGKENMNYSSEKIFAGDKKVTNKSSLSWN